MWLGDQEYDKPIGKMIDKRSETSVLPFLRNCYYFGRTWIAKEPRISHERATDDNPAATSAFAETSLPDITKFREN